MLPDNPSPPCILVIGALGQVGRELVDALRTRHARVVAADLPVKADIEAPYYAIDVTERSQLFDLIAQEGITEVYHLAAVLSAKGEQQPDLAWKLNMDGLINVLEAARRFDLQKIFWPSSIAIFGPHSPRKYTPQYCATDPSTMYGISKLAGESWCAYYHERFGIDIRSLRYPGLIGYKSLPGGGTTDYAVDIFHQALTKGAYTCYLEASTALPMMYMPDAVRATLALMDAPAERLTIRSSYNLSGLSFTPYLLAAEIQKHLPTFRINYEPDFRQAIADSWPESIDDTPARADWGWEPQYDLASMTADMLRHVAVRYTARAALSD
ncbi:MAG: NAD-dependent epimerase/dehydratase family protein [Bacteroidia bacterium]